MMFQLSKETIEQLAKHGGLFGVIIGILVAVLIIAIVFLWRANGKKDETISDLHEKRMDESKEMNDALLDHSLKAQEVMTGITNAMNSLKDAIFLSRQSGGTT